MSAFPLIGPDVEPQLRAETDPALAAACRAASASAHAAWRSHDRATLAGSDGMGADGTDTMLIDRLVEDAILEAAQQHKVNVLSEEAGFVDNGSDRTLVVDPLDGSANAAAGVPLSCFSGVIVDGDTPVEALTCWIETGRALGLRAGEDAPWSTSGVTSLAGSAISLLRPKVGPLGDSTPAWHNLVDASARVRILSTTCLESMLVATGAVDAFADPGSDTHRLVDLYAAMILVPAAGGHVCDAYGRPIAMNTDLTRRWSGIIAASQPLAEEMAEVIRAAVPGPEGP